MNPIITSTLVALATLFIGCQTKLPPPVDIFPEDNCAFCRMSVSQSRFASEIIIASGAVRKFDDLGCLDGYRKVHPDETPMVTYLRNYLTDVWINADSCLIVKTGLATPMASGRVAVADSAAARQILNQYPPPVSAGGME